MRRITAAGLAALLFGGAAEAEPLSDGWWVVVGSSPAPGSEWTARDDAFLARVTAAMAPCGVEAFNDWSSKFDGMAPEFHVAVVGAFATMAEARAAREEVLACAPDAYLRRARYLGE